MLKPYKYRIYPTDEQIILINKHIGASRFIFNLALETKQMAWVGNRVNLSCFDLMNQIPDLKKDYTWLKEINSQSLQQSVRHLDNAFTRFYKKQSEFPKFKKKSAEGTFSIPQSIYFKDNKCIIPKFKKGIKTVLHRDYKGVIKQATIIRSSTGKYFISILCETNEKEPEKYEIKENTAIGIDLGIKTFIVTSNGNEFANPKFLHKAQGKLKYIQRKFSKNKGKRTRQRVAALHGKVANQRKDFLHKVSSKLINNHDSICIETLQVSNMLKNQNLAKHISDAGWGIFVEMLEYKANWYGKNIIRIGRFEPSSKTCSSCGKINKELTLKDRVWTCKCGVTHDRDINAAVNIKSFALMSYLSGEHTLKNQDELPTLVGVLTPEA